MALTADNVIVALTGAAMVADVGATAPTDASTAWGGGWTDLGFISEDGIDYDANRESKEIKAFQNGAVVRKMNTGEAPTWKFTLLETTAAGLGLYFAGATITGAAPGTGSIDYKGANANKKAFGLDIVDGDRLIRWVIPLGEVSDIGTLAMKNGEPYSYELTITGYPGPGGTRFKKFWTTAA